MANDTARRTSALYRGMAGIVRPLMWALGTPRWRGVENLPTSGGVIVAGNHINDLDPLTAAHSLYSNGAPPRIMAKSELFKVPVLGSIMRSTQMIPVERGTRHAADSLDAAREALAAGEVVLIFPEGTHTRDPEYWPMVARTGVARLALTTGAPVIPLAQWGANLVMPPHKPYFKPFPRPHFDVVFGPPVDLSDLMPPEGQPPSAEALTAATARIMAAITQQLAEIRGEEPPPEPFDRRKAGV